MTEPRESVSVDVVIPVHNAPVVTKRCVASVLKHRDPDTHRLILVDDGSGDETASFLRAVSEEEPNCLLIRSESASGYTKAANRGLTASSGDMVIVLNSDTEVPERWVEKISEVMFYTPGVGIVGPLSNAASYQSIPRQAPNEKERLAGQTVVNEMPPGMNLQTVNRWLEENMGATPVRVPLVHGFCLAIRREVMDSIGLFDEESFPQGFGEEDDYCIRAVDAGWSLAIATKVYVWHEKSQSYGDERRRELVGQSRSTFVNNHGARRRSVVLTSVAESGDRLTRHTSAMWGIQA